MTKEEIERVAFFLLGLGNVESVDCSDIATPLIPSVRIMANGVTAFARKYCNISHAPETNGSEDRER